MHRRNGRYPPIGPTVHDSSYKLPIQPILAQCQFCTYSRQSTLTLTLTPNFKIQPVRIRVVLLRLNLVAQFVTVFCTETTSFTTGNIRTTKLTSNTDDVSDIGSTDSNAVRRKLRHLKVRFISETY